MATKIGSRRHRVTISRRTNTTSLDSRGQLSESFATVETKATCSIRRLTGDEGTLARQTFPTATHTVNMRWRDGITSKDKLTFGTRTLHILDVDNVLERNRELVLTVGEEV